MADPFDQEAYVPQAAAALGLPIAPTDLGDVVAAFAMLARVAGVVMAFPLPEETVAGAVFTAEKGDA
jgi:Protein of unknown function (DUF4089)